MAKHQRITNTVVRETFNLRNIQLYVLITYYVFWKCLVDIIFLVLDYEYFLATNVRLKLNCSFREWRLCVWNWIARPESGDCAFEIELLILRVETVRLKLNCSSLEWRLARLNQERSFLNWCEQGKRATPQETQVVSFLVDSPSFQSIIRNYTHWVTFGHLFLYTYFSPPSPPSYDLPNRAVPDCNEDSGTSDWFAKLLTIVAYTLLHISALLDFQLTNLVISVWLTFRHTIFHIV